MAENGFLPMKPAQQYDLDCDGLILPLRRYASGHAGAATVLLLHGGNTSSRLFAEPSGGLIKYLTDHGVDVWTLDWRASADIVEPLLERGPLGGDEARERDLFTLDRAAEVDIPMALNKMREEGVQRTAVLGFCLGGGALSIAIARGELEDLGVGNVVLVTMGLFYEVAWDGWVKAEDFILERMLATAPEFRGVSAAAPDKWPKELKSAYERWPKAWLGGNGRRPIDELFRRLTFMYGEPYARGRLAPGFERGLLEGFFGSLHLGLYLHASQMVRRGFAARNNQPDVIDRSRLGKSKASCPAIVSDLVPDYFMDKRVTVMAGADDRLWHRDSIDLMYEWLRNEATPPGEPARHRKHVLPLYGHLDLFWGEDAEQDVYPLFEAAIKQPPLPAHTRAARSPRRARGKIDAAEPPPAPPTMSGV